MSDIGIGGKVFAGIHKRGAPFMIHPAKQAEMLRARVDKIAVVLHADDDAKLLSILRAFVQRIGHPGFDGFSARVASGLLPVFGRVAATKGCAQPVRQLRRDFDPGLDALHALGPHTFVGGRKIIMPMARPRSNAWRLSLMR